MKVLEIVSAFKRKYKYSFDVTSNQNKNRKISPKKLFLTDNKSGKCGLDFIFFYDQLFRKLKYTDYVNFEIRVIIKELKPAAYFNI